MEPSYSLGQKPLSFRRVVFRRCKCNVNVVAVEYLLKQTSRFGNLIFPA
ncbi:hypothetical protein LEP1GSC050_2958 [Leptospira broomii serovar Hurstbridge str. 5399]|uniref:Uncharacterized protein n=1 Tax=Leptospira broomii serovar Hurstbridge str. 5399 TaxID=1049789 RepID=T0FCU6_9LEPT|nr:hypothetical protein LEP1GSC050_2958 [Leptospira broomii serovar Hurstbridge str. 5399]